MNECMNDCCFTMCAHVIPFFLDYDIKTPWLGLVHVSNKAMDIGRMAHDGLRDRAVSTSHCLQQASDAWPWSWTQVPGPARTAIGKTCRTSARLKPTE